MLDLKQWDPDEEQEHVNSTEEEVEQEPKNNSGEYLWPSYS